MSFVCENGFMYVWRTTSCLKCSWTHKFLSLQWISSRLDCCPLSPYWGDHHFPQALPKQIARVRRWCSFLFVSRYKFSPTLLKSRWASYLCVLRSLSVGIFISADYWWTTNVALRGLDEVSSMWWNGVRVGLVTVALLHLVACDFLSLWV